MLLKPAESRQKTTRSPILAGAFEGSLTAAFYGAPFTPSKSVEFGVCGGEWLVRHTEFSVSAESAPAETSTPRLWSWDWRTHSRGAPAVLRRGTNLCSLGLLEQGPPQTTGSELQRSKKTRNLHAHLRSILSVVLYNDVHSNVTVGIQGKPSFSQPLHATRWHLRHRVARQARPCKTDNGYLAVTQAAE